MGGFTYVLAALAVGIAFSLQKTAQSIRSLRDRSASELSQLKSELSSRHLIVSHLVDSLPATFDRHFDRKRLGEVRDHAERALQLVDPNSPNSADMQAFANCEQELEESVDHLTSCIEADGVVRSAQSVSACLQGLRQATRKINDAVSSYNAAAITYTSYFETPPTSFLCRVFRRNDFGLFDLDPPSSDHSSPRLEL